eukprot:EG_transcript_32932
MLLPLFLHVCLMWLVSTTLLDTPMQVLKVPDEFIQHLGQHGQLAQVDKFREMIPQETGDNVYGPAALESLMALLDDLGMNATQQDENWVRFVVPDPRIASGGLIGFAGYNQTTANVPSVSFKMGFAVNLNRLQKMEFANFYNLRHSWGRLVTMPGAGGNLYLWMDQLLPSTEVTSMQVSRDAAILYGELARGFL